MARAAALPRRHTAAGPTAAGPTAAEIRAWARLEGLAVPERGRIPVAVRDAWERASAAAPAPADDDGGSTTTELAGS